MASIPPSMPPVATKVLVVDDEPGLRHVLEVTFRRQGYEVVSAPGARQAMDQIRQHPQPFPLVLSSPAGGGKTTIAKALVAARDDVGYSISATTRPKRPGEQDGARAVKDELPIGVSQKGLKLGAVSRCLDDDQIGSYGERTAHNRPVCWRVPIRVHVDLHVRECRTSCQTFQARACLSGDRFIDGVGCTPGSISPDGLDELRVCNRMEQLDVCA